MLRPIYKDLWWITILVIVGIVVVFVMPVVSPMITIEVDSTSPTASPEVWILGVFDVMLMSLLVSLSVAGLTAGLIQSWVETNYERKRG